MWALPGATFVVPRSALVAGADNTIINVPVPSFLIEHPKGLVLFDTGSHPKVAEDVGAYWGEMFRGMVKFSKDLTVDNQIKALGYKLTDVKYVVMSHFHMDHTGGLFMFPHAKLLTMKGEISYAYWPAPHLRNIFLIDDILPTRNYNWLELSDNFDLFGDGSLVALHTPGHTPGSCSLVVRLPHQEIILAGDVVHLRDAIDTDATMLVDTDPNQSVASIRRLKALRDMHGSRIWVSHDPDDWEEMPHAPKALE